MTAVLAPSAPFRDEARAVIGRHSKSFSLAALLLGPELRDEASLLYAYCRRADDAVDLVSADEAPARVAQLQRELDAVYAGRSSSEPVLAAFQRLVFERRIPKAYPQALLEGFELDASGKRYQTFDELLHYCWCVAGSVGAMMCHLLGVRRRRAVVHGVHLGMAMQLTNMCRDVAEDWQRGRLYLPLDLTPELARRPEAGPLHDGDVPVLARAVRQLLAHADRLYASGDRGLPYLPFRARWGVATARRVYSSIGERILAQEADVRRGRAVVSGFEKGLHVVAAAATSAGLAALTPSFRPADLSSALRFPEDVLPY